MRSPCNAPLIPNIRNSDKATLNFSTAGVGVLSLSGVHAGGTEEYTFGSGALNATQKRTIQAVDNKTAQTASLPGLAKQVQGSIANTLMANTMVGNSTNFTTSFRIPLQILSSGPYLL